MTPADRLTVIIEGEDDVFMALRPEFDIASEGPSIEEPHTNLIEALTLCFETHPHLKSPGAFATKSL